MTTELLRTRVATGAAALDVTEGVSPDWRKDINLTTLDVGFPTVCILGQIFGEYDKGAAKLGFEAYGDEDDDPTNIELGFMPDDDDPRSEALTEAWREYLLGSS